MSCSSQLQKDKYNLKKNLIFLCEEAHQWKSSPGMRCGLRWGMHVCSGPYNANIHTHEMFLDPPSLCASPAPQMCFWGLGDPFEWHVAWEGHSRKEELIKKLKFFHLWNYNIGCNLLLSLVILITIVYYDYNYFFINLTELMLTA